MAATKSKHSVELPKDSLYDELINKTRKMPLDVKEMLGHVQSSQDLASSRKVSRSRSRNKSLEEPRPSARKPSEKRGASEPAPTLKKKFEEHEKRKTIDEYLKTSNKTSVSKTTDDIPLKLQTSRERKLTVLNSMRETPLNIRYLEYFTLILELSYES